VNDAYRRLPYADILYACDEKWWRLHVAAVDEMFHGERWTTHEGRPGDSNDKSAVPPDWKLNFIRGRHADTFSADPDALHYGSNSGFQAINLALLKGATRVALVGFDMGGRGHFFGEHPEPLHNRADYSPFLREFREAAKGCTVPVLNATPGSALDCFAKVTLEEALGHDLLGTDGRADRHRPNIDAGADRHGQAQGLCAGGL
jgi:hypothetical protein